MMARYHFKQVRLLRDWSFWKQLLARAFLFQCDCFGRTKPGGKKNLVITTPLGINNFSDHFVIQLKNFRRRLDASCVPFTLGSVHSDFHETSSTAFKKLKRTRWSGARQISATVAVGRRTVAGSVFLVSGTWQPVTSETLLISQREQARAAESL